MLKTMKNYSSFWYFNSPHFRLLLAIVKNNVLAHRLMFLALVIFLAAVLLWRAPFEKKIFLCFFGFILINPVIYPWYLIVLLGLLSIHESRLALYWSGPILFSYFVAYRFHVTGDLAGFVAGDGSRIRDTLVVAGMAMAEGKPAPVPAADMNNTIILFFRYPRLGKVKTRLARVVGAEQALELYRSSLRKTMQTARALPHCRLAFAVEPPHAVSLLKKKYGEQVDVYAQHGTDLGERMQRAIRQALSLGANKVILVGADIPALSERILTEAFLELERHQVVLGPAADGGYYLIGMKRSIPELFSGIAWSTDTVFSATLAILARDGITYSLLPELHDLDDADDLAHMGNFLGME